MSSPERWEATQLIASGAMKIEDYPTYDQDGGLGDMEQNDDGDDDGVEEEIEIDINDDEAPFLKGQTGR